MLVDHKQSSTAASEGQRKGREAQGASPAIPTLRQRPLLSWAQAKRGRKEGRSGGILRCGRSTARVAGGVVGTEGWARLRLQGLW